MQFSTFTQIILLACAPLAMAGVAASPVDSLNVFESRANPIVCNKADCGGVGKACAGKWVGPSSELHAFHSRLTAGLVLNRRIANAY